MKNAIAISTFRTLEKSAQETSYDALFSLLELGTRSNLDALRHIFLKKLRQRISESDIVHMFVTFGILCRSFFIIR